MANLYEPSGKQRIESIDILRGAVMLIMAIDHCRDFFHHAGALGDPTNMATTTPFFFFTRWITHFCAPTFLFLSGISAFLAGTRRTKAELSAFLIKRGLWIILVELVLLTFALTFNPFYNSFILQVLWAIGFSMVILGLVVRAPLAVIGILGALIFFGHDILDFVTLPKAGAAAILIKIFLTAQGTVIPLGKTHFIFDLYAVIPWTGVMLLGYVFGTLFQKTINPQQRKKILLITGLSVTAFYIILRFTNLYGDPNPWAVQRNGVYTVLSFLNTSKYPPSLLYLCMTLGPAITLLALIEHTKNKFTAILTVYGNVPFFYYVLHFYLIHLITVVLFFASGYTVHQINSPGAFFLFRPVDFGYSLGIVYLIWFLVITSLYLPCRWFSKYKKTHNQWWLSYL
ncbi:DUF1624 domain-containing protein [Mucilaginibacter gotjawali]|uniref:Membrane protein n=2 Tax=Mucilaginibacter gotjawali TaxID=1550579 RepID=A0A839SK31_9SPHI|nr:heparan-alpha-glucosaminide N-acetyltransferase domain-containing protein [Mucilaginibacter gotjawali]MBB3057812.1 putative membrane protein [Mucilaginibacter gotjawali]BAU52614.1 hypothetical protein MgSA37_00776 [Mucilaginibacter gotjawali]